MVPFGEKAPINGETHTELVSRVLWESAGDLHLLWSVRLGCEGTNDQVQERAAVANWRNLKLSSPLHEKQPGQAQAAHHHEWRECEGVCFDGVCALRWDSPSCCIIAGPDSRQDDYGRPDDSCDHRFRDEGDQDTAPYAADVPKADVSSY